jgi:tRNA(fMet)-specific endonuclease VapC
MALLLDTNIISEIARRPNGAAAAKLRLLTDPLLTSIIVAGELAFGLEKLPSTKWRRQILAVLQGLEIVEITSPVEEHYGRIRARLENAGTPIGSNDTWIAAHALALDCTLVTANEREFRRVPGLRVENWLA